MRNSIFKANKKMTFDKNNWTVTTYQSGDKGAAILIEGEDNEGNLIIYHCGISTQPLSTYLQEFSDQKKPSNGALYSSTNIKNPSIDQSIASEVVSVIFKKQLKNYPQPEEQLQIAPVINSKRVTKAHTTALLNRIDTEKNGIDIATRLLSSAGAFEQDSDQNPLLKKRTPENWCYNKLIESEILDGTQYAKPPNKTISSFSSSN